MKVREEEAPVEGSGAMATATRDRLQEVSALLGETARGMPRPVAVPGGRSFELKVMGPEDREALGGLAESLSEEDMLALHSDIGEEAVVERWLSDIRVGRTFTLLAQESYRAAGLVNLYLNPTSWTRHVGEMQIIVCPEHRGVGLGRALGEEMLAAAAGLGLGKVIAQMPNDEPAAQHVFRRLGFEAVTLLPGFALGPEGKPRDLLLMSLEGVGATAPGSWPRG